MEQIQEFVSNHTMLVAILFAIVGLIIFTEFGRITRKYKQIPAAEAVALVNNEDALILDVRENNEVANGVISSRIIHISLGSLEKRISEINDFKDKPVLVYCRSGNRSGQACNILVKHEFVDAHNLAGGIMAWQEANLPLQKKK